MTEFAVTKAWLVQRIGPVAIVFGRWNHVLRHDELYLPFKQADGQKGAMLPPATTTL